MIELASKKRTPRELSRSMIAMGLNLEWLRQHDSAAKLLVSQDRQAVETDSCQKGNNRPRRMGHNGSLATALVALEQLPPKHQPRTQMEDIRKLLAAGCQPGTVDLHLAQAKCRLFPDLNREYGLEDGQP